MKNKYSFKAIVDGVTIYPKGFYYQDKYIILVGDEIKKNTIRRKEFIEDVEIFITKNIIRKYLIGNSAIYGSIVAKPDKLSELDEKTFYKLLQKSLKNNKLTDKKFKLIRNLKRGITIGDEYFLIEDI